MKKTSETIVFFGNERLATGVTTTAPTLQALIIAGYKIAAVVSHNEPTSSRTQRALEIADIAKTYNIPVLLPEKPALIIDQLKDLKADIGVLAAYGKIVPQSVIDVFTHGIINIHPSLLPKHRGPTPLESVILQGETETGVSVMQLVKAMDAGPVYAQTKVRLRGHESKQELANKLLGIGSQMVLDVLTQVWSERAQPMAQDNSKAAYDDLITKDDGVLDWSKPAEQLEREVRAYLEWPKSRTILAGKDVVITKAHVVAGSGTPGSIWRDGKSFGIYTTRDILAIDALKPAGKPEMAVAAFLAGYGHML